MGSNSAMKKLMLAACLIVAVIHLSSAAHSYQKRSPYTPHSKRAQNYRSAAEEDEPKWKPNTEPTQFKFRLNDNIQGAGQVREEKVENGNVEGSWAVPVDEAGKMWKETKYRAGKDGFHIVSEKVVPKEELVGNLKTGEGEANVEIDQLGGNTAYNVKASDLKKSGKGKDL